MMLQILIYVLILDLISASVASEQVSTCMFRLSFHPNADPNKGGSSYFSGRIISPGNLDTCVPGLSFEAHTHVGTRKRNRTFLDLSFVDIK